MTQYLLVKRGLYWRPNAQGYTGIKSEAGRYSDRQSVGYSDAYAGDQTYRIAEADADDFAPACSDADRARHWQQRAETAEAQLARATPSPRHPREGGDPGQPEPLAVDYFGELVIRAHIAAAKASRKFPQPNYVTLKIAEEAGEVVRGAVHFAEGRMPWEEVEGEIVQLLAMLIRFVSEGDEINGVIPPTRTPPAPVAPDEAQP